MFEVIIELRPRLGSGVALISIVFWIQKSHTSKILGLEKHLSKSKTKTEFRLKTQKRTLEVHKKKLKRKFFGYLQNENTGQNGYR